MLNRRRFLGSSLALAAVSATPLVLTGCDDSWTATAQKDVPVVVNILEQLVAAAGTALQQGQITSDINVQITKYAGVAQQGLTAVQALFANFAISPNATVLDKIQAGILDVQKTLNLLTPILALIPGVNFSSALSQALSLGLSVVSAILALIPNKATASFKTSKTYKVALPKPEELKKSFNNVVIANGYPQHTV